MISRMTFKGFVLNNVPPTRASWYATQKIPLLTGLVVLGIDQLSKCLAREILPLGASLPVEGVLRFRRVANDGIIFGINARPAISLLLPLALMAVALLWCWRYVQSNSQLLNTALALVVCGGLGNLADRLVFGQVTDFISVGIPGTMIGVTLNLADLSVMAGAVLFLIYAASLGKTQGNRGPQTEAV